MKKYGKYIIPSLITFAILGYIFYVNRLYPFGKHSIVKVDADYQFIPVLYRIYDFLHGNGNILYDDIGFGNNIYISMIIQGSIFSPVNLLLYFTSRNNIINYFDILVMVKLCLISLTCYIYVENSYKVNYFYKVIGSVLYTFCGFIVLNYFNIMWLDSIILFPLIVMYLDRLLNNKGYIGYIICLSLSLIITYYISYYIMLFILFYSFIHIFLSIKNVDERKKIIFRLGISTLISLLISSFSVIPSVYQTVISSRFNTGSSYELFGSIVSKSFYVLFSPLFVILSILYISRYKKDKLGVYRFILLVILFHIGLFIEPINLLIHGGSHWDFPFRYGFVSTFILMMGSFKFLEDYDLVNSNKHDLFKLFCLIELFGVLIHFNDKYLSDILEVMIVLRFDNDMVVYEIFIMILIIFIMYIVCFMCGNKYLRYFGIFLTSVSSIYVICSWTMCYEKGYFLTINANNFNNNINVIRDGRYKVDYTTYTPDYGFVLDVDTLDNWLHVIPNGIVNNYSNLGYMTSDTCIRSYGGTIFSDWLFNVRYLISNKVKDNMLYENIGSHNNKYLYKYRYNYSNGIVFKYDGNVLYNDNRLEYQNNIYQDLFGNDKDIIDVGRYTTNGNKLNIRYDNRYRGILYLDISEYDDVDFVVVNDRYYYDFDKYIMDMGIYDSNISIDIYFKDDGNYIVDVGFIRIDDIINLRSNVSYSDNTYYVNSDSNDNYLFLPINNIDGIKVYVNGIRKDIISYLDNFILVKLDNGDNYVNISYSVPFLKLGIVLSVIGILLFIFYKNIKYNDMILNVVSYLYVLINVFVFLYYYLYSMFKYFISR